MFTAWGGQMPFRQIGDKGTKKNAHMQKKALFFGARSKEQGVKTKMYRLSVVADLSWLFIQSLIPPPVSSVPFVPSISSGHSAQSGTSGSYSSDEKTLQNYYKTLFFVGTMSHLLIFILLLVLRYRFPRRDTEPIPKPPLPITQRALP